MSVRNLIRLPELLDLDVHDQDAEIPPLDWLGSSELRGTPQSGIKALMQAVLEDGVRCYLANEPRVRDEAESWILSPGRTSPFSFRVVCETLGLEPGAVRLALERLRAKDLSPRQALGRTRPNVRRPARLLARHVA